MKKLIPIFVLVLSICVMWSCEKEETIPQAETTTTTSTTTPPPATNTNEVNLVESYLKNLETEVLFASLTIEHETEEVSGWFIDNQGAIRKINSEVSVSLRDEIVTLNTINGLLTDSELAMELSATAMEKLVTTHRKASLAVSERNIETDSELSTSSAFLSYQFLSSGEGQDCSGADSTAHNMDVVPLPTFQQNLIVATGHLNQTATEQMQTITDFLKELDEEVGN